jgi:outer membrane scaffolding protein for murein synthesis (MipA/OmpV family)
MQMFSEQYHLAMKETRVALSFVWWCRTLLTFGVVCTLIPALYAAESVKNSHDYAWLGPVVSVEEAYAGAAHKKAALLPLADVQRGALFARSTRGYGELGYRVGNAASGYRGWSAGLQLGFEKGRAANDLSERAQRMGLDAYSDHLGLGAHTQWQGSFGPAPVNAVLRYRQRLPEQRGVLLDLRYDMGVYESGAFGLGVFYQGIWANERAMQSDFAVNAAQASAVGQAAYTPGAGWREHNWGLAAKWDWSRQTMLIASVRHKRLGDAAAASPVAEASSVLTWATGVMWQF